MLEYGIKVIDDSVSRNKSTSLYVYFTPMTYFDWIYFSSTENSFDMPYIRGIFSRYITRITTEDKTEYTIYDLLESPDNVKMKIINSMLDKAGFDNEEALLKTVNKCREKSGTLAGIYDTFVMINTDFNFYVQFLNSDIFTRSQIISSLEKMKHFTVEERYMDGIKEGIDINLVHDDESYEKWKFDRNKKKSMAGHDKQKPAVAEKREILGDDINSIIEQSKNALNEAMLTAKKEPRKTFNWEQDEKDFGD